MRAINHALTGAVIGLSIDNPALALPLAFLSHFVLDAIPHYGSSITGDATLRSKAFTAGLYIDAVACGLLVLLLFMVHPKQWLQAAIAAFLAASPDFFSLGRYLAARRGKTYKPNLYARFASNIQWFERPIGGYVEAVWFIAMSWILYRLIG